MGHNFRLPTSRNKHRPTTTSTKMTVAAPNTTTKKVCFAAVEVSAVHPIEKPDKSESESLFYQDEDYVQFRASFNKFRAQQQRQQQQQRNAQLLRFDAMSRQVRAELAVSNQPKLVAAPLPTPLMSRPQRRSSVTQKGCARMA